MRRKHMVMVFTGALAAATAFGGTASAGSSYPPDGTTATTLVGGASGSRPETYVAPTAGELPQTGADSDASLKIAASALVAGAGLVVVAKRRRRPADA